MVPAHRNRSKPTGKPLVRRHRRRVGHPNVSHLAQQVCLKYILRLLHILDIYFLRCSNKTGSLEVDFRPSVLAGRCIYVCILALLLFYMFCLAGLDARYRGKSFIWCRKRFTRWRRWHAAFAGETIVAGVLFCHVHWIWPQFCEFNSTYWRVICSFKLKQHTLYTMLLHSVQMRTALSSLDADLTSVRTKKTLMSSRPGHIRKERKPGCRGKKMKRAFTEMLSAAKLSSDDEKGNQDVSSKLVAVLQQSLSSYSFVVRQHLP